MYIENALYKIHYHYHSEVKIRLKKFNNKGLAMSNSVNSSLESKKSKSFFLNSIFRPILLLICFLHFALF